MNHKMQVKIATKMHETRLQQWIC